MTKDDERAAFEAWYLRDMPHETYLLKRTTSKYRQPECYEDDSVEECWAGWQARAASPQATPAQTRAPIGYVHFEALEDLQNGSHVNLSPKPGPTYRIPVYAAKDEK